MQKRRPDLPLNQLRTFSVAARHSTLTAAAQTLGVSQVAVSRQIKALEDYLDIKLFERGPRSVRLTDAGRLFGQEVAEAFDKLDDATLRLLSEESAGTINVRVYPTFAHHWLLPRLGDFVSQFPDCRIHLDTVVRPLDFRNTELDVAVQLGHGDWSNARSRKLFNEVVDLVCSPNYARRLSESVARRNLANADLLYAKYRRRVWEIWAEQAGVEIDRNRGLEFDSSLLAYNAAERGYGLAIGQIDLLDSELADGRLVCPFGKPVSTGSAFHVVWPTMTSASAHVRHFIDWLLETSGKPAEFSNNEK
jgi:LysR family glycine cleavage system transcriptional activator